MTIKTILLILVFSISGCKQSGAEAVSLHAAPPDTTLSTTLTPVAAITRSNDFVSVKDFGACGNGTCDDTAAIRAAIATFPNGKVKIHFPRGTYLLTDTIQISKHRVYLEGEGKHVTTILFQPTGDKEAFLFSAGGSGDLYQTGISGMGFISLDSTKGKVAIKSVTTSQLAVSDIAVLLWSGGTSGSIGLQIQGHELATISNISVNTDRPIVIEDNPISSIDMDHFHFQDVYLIASPSYPCVSIASGVNLTNVIFDGFQSWANGSDGLVWNDTTANQISTGLVLKNIRWEQSKNTSGYGIYISHNHLLMNLRIENFLSGGKNVNGIFLRKILSASLSNIQYHGVQEGLNIDSSVFGLTLDSSFFQTGSAVSMNGAGVTSAHYRHGNTTVARLNPAPSSGISQIEAQPIPLGKSQIEAIGSDQMQGMLVISEATSGMTALIALMGTTHKAMEMSDPANGFSTASKTPGQYNVYWSDTNRRYEIENLSAVENASFYITLTGKGEH